MFLLVAPTDKELDALKAGVAEDLDIAFLVCGVGMLESSAVLYKYLAGTDDKIEGVVLAGIAGAYGDGGAELLDICLAGEEVLGDIGICYPDRIDPLDHAFAPTTRFQMSPELLANAGRILSEANMKFLEGTFVTVSSVSGTKLRGDHLQDSFAALCENMEGAAVSRICQEFDLPCIEIRCVSNMVLDRADQVWDIDGAIVRCSEAVGEILEKFSCGS